ARHVSEKLDAAIEPQRSGLGFRRLAVIPAVSGNDELIIFARHSRKPLDQPLQIFPGLQIPNIKEVWTLRLNRYLLGIAPVRPRCYSNAILGHAEIPHDFPF